MASTSTSRPKTYFPERPKPENIIAKSNEMRAGKPGSYNSLNVAAPDAAGNRDVQRGDRQIAGAKKAWSGKKNLAANPNLVFYPGRKYRLAGDAGDVAEWLQRHDPAEIADFRANAYTVQNTQPGQARAAAFEAEIAARKAYTGEDVMITDTNGRLVQLTPMLAMQIAKTLVNPGARGVRYGTLQVVKPPRAPRGGGGGRRGADPLLARIQKARTSEVALADGTVHVGKVLDVTKLKANGTGSVIKPMVPDKYEVVPGPYADVLRFNPKGATLARVQSTIEKVLAKNAEAAAASAADEALGIIAT